MTFTAPDVLWLLALVPALVALVVRERRRRRARLAKLGDVDLLDRLSDGVDEGRRLWLRLGGVLAFALLVVGLAGPRFGERTELLPRRGLDVVFAIDVSTSMRARDVRPDRLARTKAELSLLFDRLREHRLGIVAFAGTSFVQCPLTDDVEAARLFLSALDPSVVPQGGTDLGAGLVTAKNLFDAEAEAAPETRQAGRLLVIVTDGEDHEGGVDQAASALEQAGVDVIVLGVGSQRGEPIPVLDAAGGVLGYKRDKKGDTVMTRLSPQVLEEVATKAGGTWIDVMSRADFGLAEIEATVGRLEKRELEARIKRTHVDRSSWPLGAAFLLLVLVVALPERARPRRRRTPFVAPVTLGLLLVVVTAASGRARAEGLFSRAAPELEEGRAALERSAWDDAISRFRAAPADDPDERAVVEYDVGRALYEQGLAEQQSAAGEEPAEGEAPAGAALLKESGAAFSRAYGTARSDDIRTQAGLAEGNAWARAGDLERSIDAYRRSLVSDPENQRAKQNLQAVLRAMQQQQQQQQQNEDGGEGEQKEQEQKEEPEGGDEQQDQQQQQQDQEQQQQDQQQQQQDQQQDQQQQQQDEQEQKAPDGEKPQPEEAPGEPKDEQKQEQPSPKEGSDDDKPPEDGEAQDPKDPKKEDAKKLLDALRSRERPLNPLLMQPQRHIRTKPPEKDW